jgi:5'-deoxynucleotidase YfbR-like HD superfamily hydrolase
VKPEEEWMVTVSGRRMHITRPKPDLIEITDIAHALAKTTRFNGHTIGDEVYSVAQHSLLVSEIAELAAARDVTFPPQGRPRIALAALLHDAAEAYLGDLIRPVKSNMPSFTRLERVWEDAIAKRFGLNRRMFQYRIKNADLVALATERRDLLPHADPTQSKGALRWREDELGVLPLTKPIRVMPVATARALFLVRFQQLTVDDQKNATAV